jgi:spore coat polysaccharide biosynthesis protein SpsF
MTVVAMIQARMGSTRLPGKTLEELAGRPVLWHVIQRVREAALIDEVLVATTTNPEDDRIEEACRDWGARAFRGDPEDVLKRFHDALLFLEHDRGRIDHIVRITADCPLIDPAVIDEAVRTAVAGSYDYVSNLDPPTFPDGLDVEVMARAALEEAFRKATLPSEREHVTPYIRNNPRLKRNNLRNPVDLSSLRWTLDTADDLRFIRRIYEGLYRPPRMFTTPDILAYLEEHPGTGTINAGIRRNEGYEKSLREDQRIQVIKK